LTPPRQCGILRTPALVYFELIGPIIVSTLGSIGAVMPQPDGGNVDSPRSYDHEALYCQVKHESVEGLGDDANSSDSAPSSDRRQTIGRDDHRSESPAADALVPLPARRARAISGLGHPGKGLVTPQTPTREALRIILEYRVGCTPVIRGSTLVGILTTRDLLWAMAGQLAPKAIAPKKQHSKLGGVRRCGPVGHPEPKQKADAAEAPLCSSSVRHHAGNLTLGLVSLLSARKTGKRPTTIDRLFMERQP